MLKGSLIILRSIFLDYYSAKQPLSKLLPTKHLERYLKHPALVKRIINSFSFLLKLIPRVQLFVNRCFQCQRFVFCKTFAFVPSLLFSPLSIARRGASTKACALQITTLKLLKDTYSKKQTKKREHRRAKKRRTSIDAHGL